MCDKASIEARYGTTPSTSDPEHFSLWLTALSPVPEREKMRLLLSQRTIDRLEVCLSALSAVVRHRSAYTSVRGAVSGAASSVSVALRNVLGAIFRGEQDGEEDDEEEGGGEAEGGEVVEEEDEDEGETGEESAEGGTVEVEEDQDEE